MDQQTGGRGNDADKLSIEEPGQSIPINELYEIPVDYLKIARESAANPHLNERFTVPESRYWRFYWRPWPLMLGFGGAAAFCIWLYGALPELSGSTGWPQPTWLPLARLGLIMLTGICFMLAAPLYKPHGWTPQTADAEFQQLEDFRDKHSRMPFRRKR